jgi:hypothetical protein
MTDDLSKAKSAVRRRLQSPLGFAAVALSILWGLWQVLPQFLGMDLSTRWQVVRAIALVSLLLLVVGIVVVRGARKRTPRAWAALGRARLFAGCHAQVIECTRFGEDWTIGSIRGEEQEMSLSMSRDGVAAAAVTSNGQMRVWTIAMTPEGPAPHAWACPIELDFTNTEEGRILAIAPKGDGNLWCVLQIGDRIGISDWIQLSTGNLPEGIWKHSGSHPCAVILDNSVLSIDEKGQIQEARLSRPTTQVVWPRCAELQEGRAIALDAADASGCIVVAILRSGEAGAKPALVGSSLVVIRLDGNPRSSSIHLGRPADHVHVVRNAGNEPSKQVVLLVGSGEVVSAFVYDLDENTLRRAETGRWKRCAERLTRQISWRDIRSRIGIAARPAGVTA